MPKKKILLVDDEKDFLNVMGNRIRSWGYDLITALNGKKAMDAISSKKPDIIILDYLLPDMDGVKTLGEIRKVNPKVPVIIFTAYPDGKSIAGTEKLGISAYIPKSSIYANASGSLKTILENLEKKLK